MFLGFTTPPGHRRQTRQPLPVIIRPGHGSRFLLQTPHAPHSRVSLIIITETIKSRRSFSLRAWRLSSQACRGISARRPQASHRREPEMFRLRRGAPPLNMTRACTLFANAPRGPWSAQGARQNPGRMRVWNVGGELARSLFVDQGATVVPEIARSQFRPQSASRPPTRVSHL